VDYLRAEGHDEAAGFLRAMTGDYGKAVRQAIEVCVQKFFVATTAFL
jgi:hypothetical protein